MMITARADAVKGQALGCSTVLAHWPEHLKQMRPLFLSPHSLPRYRRLTHGRNCLTEIEVSQLREQTAPRSLR
jgi:hypothetical protein